MGGRAVRPDYICGAAGNAALIGFTNALGAETPSYNVRVFGINPAATMTDRIVTLSKARAKARFGDESRWEEVLGADKLPFGRIKTAEEVAALATMLCGAAGALPVGHRHRHGRRRPVAQRLSVPSNT